MWKYFMATMTNMTICVASLGVEGQPAFCGDDWHLGKLTEGSTPQC